MNTGKSTIINSLIGTVIVPTKALECTEQVLIIRNVNNKKEPELYEARETIDEINGSLYFKKSSEKPFLTG